GKLLYLLFVLHLELFVVAKTRGHTAVGLVSDRQNVHFAMKLAVHFLKLDAVAGDFHGHGHPRRIGGWGEEGGFYGDALNAGGAPRHSVFQIFLDRISRQSVYRLHVAVAVPEAHRRSGTVELHFEEVTTPFRRFGGSVAEQIELVLLFAD